MEDVEQNIQTLLGGKVGKTAEEAPAGKTEQVLEELAIPDATIAGGVEMAVAVALINEEDEEGDDCIEEGVEDEFVDGGDVEQVDDDEFQHHLHEGDVGVEVHALVGDDGGVVRNAQQVDDELQEGELVDPLGCAHALLGNVELGVDEPETYGLTQYDNKDGEQEIGVHGHAEHHVGLGVVLFAEEVVEETLGGGE